MNSSQAPKCNCPHCAKEFDSALNLSGEVSPQPGDWTICLGCAAPLRFTEELTVRALDELEKYRFEETEEFEQFREAVGILSRRKRDKR